MQRSCYVHPPKSRTPSLIKIARGRTFGGPAFCPTSTAPPPAPLSPLSARFSENCFAFPPLGKLRVSAAVRKKRGALLLQLLRLFFCLVYFSCRLGVSYFAWPFFTFALSCSPPPQYFLPLSSFISFTLVFCFERDCAVHTDRFISFFEKRSKLRSCSLINARSPEHGGPCARASTQCTRWLLLPLTWTPTLFSLHVFPSSFLFSGVRGTQNISVMITQPEIFGVYISGTGTLFA